MRPSCSIIIPTYNEEHYLPLLLKSIKAQTLQPKEVIVVDAYSRDKTQQIVKDYGYTLIQQKKRGPANARNCGANVASGELLLFLDSDVIISPTFLADTVNEIMERELDAASCLVIPISSKKRDMFIHFITNIYIRITEKFFIHAPGYCIFAYKKIYEQINGFDESVYLAEDHDFARRAAQIGKFGYINTHKIHVSVRRLDEEGRWVIFRKYLTSELYMFFQGKIKHRIYDYKFGEHDR